MQMMVSIILLPVCLIKGTDEIEENIYQTVSLVYVVVIYKQLLGIGWVKSALRSILALVLTMMLLIVLIILVLVAAMLIESALK